MEDSFLFDDAEIAGFEEYEDTKVREDFLLKDLNLNSPLVELTEIPAVVAKHTKGERVEFHKMMGDCLTRIIPEGVVLSDYLEGWEEFYVSFRNMMSAKLGFEMPTTINLGDVSPATKSYVRGRELFENLISIHASKTSKRGATETKLQHGHRCYIFVENFVVLQTEGRFAIGYYNDFVMWSNLYTQRANLLLYVHLGAHFGDCGYPSEDLLLRLFDWGDRLLEKRGNMAFKIIKNFEPLVNARLLELNIHDDLGTPHLFIESARRDFLESYAGADIASHNLMTNLLAQINDANVLHQCFGLFRIWGHPYVDVRKGIQKYREVSCGRKFISNKMAEEVTGEFVHLFFEHYKSRYGHYPECVKSTMPEDIRERFARTGLFTRTLSRAEWAAIDFVKIFDPSCVKEIDLIKDKACGLPLNLLSIALAKRNKGDWRERRTLVQYLMKETDTLPEVLQLFDKDEIPPEWLTIGVTPKERELKMDPRLFSLLTMQLKLYFGATEGMLAKKIVPLFPQITMTDSQEEVLKKEYEHTRLMKTIVDYVTIVISIDFAKWNWNMRHRHVVGIFQKFDQLFGFMNLFSKTHEVFQRCLFYCFDGHNWPEVVNGTIQEGEFAWRNQEGGCEGLRQKGWTLMTMSALNVVLGPEGIPYQIMGQGDNQVILLKFPVLEKDNSGNLTHQERIRIRSQFADVFKKLIDFFRDFNLQVKPDETWSSSILFTYGKAPFYKGVPKSMSLKRIARIATVANEDYPVLSTSLAGIFTNAQAAAAIDHQPLIPYLFATAEAYRCCYAHLAFNPLLGEGYLKHVKIRNPNMTEKRLAHIIMLGSSAVGGYPVQNFFDFFMRGFQDSLNSYLTWNEFLASSETRVEFRTILSAWAAPVLGASKEKVMLLQDPFSLNLKSSLTKTTLVKKRLEEVLERSTLVRNENVKLLVFDQEEQKRVLARFLLSGSTVNPLLAASVYALTPTGVLSQLLDRFTNTKSLRMVATSDGVTFVDKIVLAEHSFLENVIFQGTVVGVTRWVEECVCLFAHRLRKTSWDVEIVGITTPHPFHVLQPRSQSHAFDALVIDSVDKAPWIDRTKSLGVMRPYFGGNVSKIASEFAYQSESSSNLYNKFKQVLSEAGVVYKLDSTCHSYIKSLFESYSDLPFELFDKESTDESGNWVWRQHSSMVFSGGFLMGCYGPFTHMRMSTNELQTLTDGSNRMSNVNFQAILCSYQTLASLEVFVSNTVKDRNCYPISCKKCIFSNSLQLVDFKENPPYQRPIRSTLLKIAVNEVKYNKKRFSSVHGIPVVEFVTCSLEEIWDYYGCILWDAIEHGVFCHNLEKFKYEKMDFEQVFDAYYSLSYGSTSWGHRHHTDNYNNLREKTSTLSYIKIREQNVNNFLSIISGGPLVKHLTDAATARMTKASETITQKLVSKLYAIERRVHLVRICGEKSDLTQVMRSQVGLLIAHIQDPSIKPLRNSEWKAIDDYFSKNEWKQALDYLKSLGVGYDMVKMNERSVLSVDLPPKKRFKRQRVILTKSVILERKTKPGVFKERNLARIKVGGKLPLFASRPFIVNNLFKTPGATSYLNVLLAKENLYMENEIAYSYPLAIEDSFVMNLPALANLDYVELVKVIVVADETELFDFARLLGSLVGKAGMLRVLLFYRDLNSLRTFVGTFLRNGVNTQLHTVLINGFEEKCILMTGTPNAIRCTVEVSTWVVDPLQDYRLIQCSEDESLDETVEDENDPLFVSYMQRVIPRIEIRSLFKRKDYPCLTLDHFFPFDVTGDLSEFVIAIPYARKLEIAILCKVWYENDVALSCYINATKQLSFEEGEKCVLFLNLPNYYKSGKLYQEISYLMEYFTREYPYRPSSPVTMADFGLEDE